MCTVRTSSNTCQASEGYLLLLFVSLTKPSLRWATDPAVDLQVAELRPISGSSKHEYTRVLELLLTTKRARVYTTPHDHPKRPRTEGGGWLPLASTQYWTSLESCEEGSTFNRRKYGGLKKIERMTLGELNDYLLKFE
ncbi:hypothetical protein F2Q69_00014780 [Brassica cretica]|uniref:Uncharacterized protein n=1 Tax=Brassica cretica TaxID=69181 RepID=A0A8S9R5Q9_BRACR|nr:hypothetical protein F2Q69_00014780 [Brassica cretica]